MDHIKLFNINCCQCDYLSIAQKDEEKREREREGGGRANSLNSLFYILCGYVIIL